MASVTETAPYKGVIAYFPVSDAKKAIAFYEKAFAGKVVDTRPTDDGRLMHCEMTINDGPVMFNDPFPEHGMGTNGTGDCTMTLTVADVQAWWDRAIAAGCKVEHRAARRLLGRPLWPLVRPVRREMGAGRAESVNAPHSGQKNRIVGTPTTITRSSSGAPTRQ